MRRAGLLVWCSNPVASVYDGMRRTSLWLGLIKQFMGLHGVADVLIKNYRLDIPLKSLSYATVLISELKPMNQRLFLTTFV